MPLGTAEHNFPISPLDARSFAAGGWGGEPLPLDIVLKHCYPPSLACSEQNHGRASDHGKSSR